MKKIKNEGFTLVELLAVIVILGAIALIITPVIRDTIDNSKKKNFINSAYQLIKAADIYYLENDMMEEDIEEITFDFPSNTGNLEFKGTAPKGGNMTINENGDVALAVTDGNYCARKGFNDKEIIASTDTENCYIYKDSILNGANPELKNGMIPVIIKPDGKVLKSNETSKWYDYSNKNWANAVMVTEETRHEYMIADEGTNIKESDILAYFVWIPRYKYKLWYVEAVSYAEEYEDSSKIHSINITFENSKTPKSNGTNNGEYLTHPAFTFGDEELNGIWVAKFESHNSSNNILIKPNVVSWRNINLKDSFYYSKDMNKNNNIYGFNNDSDTHLMKNTEWGAVAYLSHSKYGKNNEVLRNNNNEFLTGCGANSTTEESTSTCKNKYGTKYNNVYNQSTTGNISGIFDMSGGSYEFVMAFPINSTGSYYNTGFTAETFPESKYVNIYNSSNYTSYDQRILGDATGEMGPFFTENTKRSSWYKDSMPFPYFKNPLTFRGGCYSNTVAAGIFTLNTENFDTHNSLTFRIAVS